MLHTLGTVPVRIAHAEVSTPFVAQTITAGATVRIARNWDTLARPQVSGTSGGVPVPDTAGLVNGNWLGDVWVVAGAAGVQFDFELLTK